MGQLSLTILFQLAQGIAGRAQRFLLSRRMRYARKRVARGLLLLVLIPTALLVVLAALTSLPDALRGPVVTASSVRIVDRDGFLLREVRAEDGSRAAWMSRAEIGNRMALAVIAAEDRHFFVHPGVDPVAVVRAILTSFWHRRIVSGASTLTMQLARNLVPRKRNALGKVHEMALALRIEASVSKERILNEYLNRAPFGAQLRGVGAASRYYFDKPPSVLSWAEAAMLAGIPRGPSLYSLRRHPERVKRRRDRVLARLCDAGVITREDYERAVAEPLSTLVARGNFGAPHFTTALLAGVFTQGTPRKTNLSGPLATTIERDLQRVAEESVTQIVAGLRVKRVSHAAVVVLDNHTREVLAYVGSPDFSDGKHEGQNDGVLALRQPGSTLKPFVYATAIENLHFTPATLLPDVELRIEEPHGFYEPHNYDGRYHGPVRLREALANSYNVPAVWTTFRVGTARVLDALHRFGFATLRESPETYGAALALGDGEVRLLDLANAYASLAEGGVWKPVSALRVQPGASAAESRVLESKTAWMLTDILADKTARASSFGERTVLEFPFDVAAKTGTSKGYRDNWTVGYSSEVTVAVWVGNFDGTPMQGTTGLTGAAPIFANVMQAAMQNRVGLSLRARDHLGFRRVSLCALSGAHPSGACRETFEEWLDSSSATPAECTFHEKVAIEPHSGLRATPGCKPQVERVFEHYDSVYLAWASGAHRDLVPANVSSLCGATALANSEAVEPLNVTYPRDGAHFLLHPDRARAAQQFTVRASGGREPYELEVDGHTLRANLLRVALTPGNHALVVKDRDGRTSNTQHFSVDSYGP